MKRTLTVSIPELAEISGASKYSLRKDVDAGYLPRFGTGRNVRIPLLAALALLGIDGAEAKARNGATLSAESEEQRAVANATEPLTIDLERLVEIALSRALDAKLSQPTKRQAR